MKEKPESIKKTEEMVSKGASQSIMNVPSNLIHHC